MYRVLNSYLNLNSTDLIPVIVVEFYSYNIIMFAYVSGLCLRLSLNTKIGHYYNRCTQGFWLKGLESGNIHLIQQVYFDCDCDVVLFNVLIVGKGYVCHTFRYSCFYCQLCE
ncbi:MAG: phosphoribosyl-AMP cyclohydrolase [Candidatus Hodgkinia cicadicola]